ncbi:DUF126 domain-containing protein [Acuticoccus sp. MNP-M23]|uniref:aconitase X swivel domain-containing protein n=1 Tax=Acuticoccus sp. MNP-M23 TaxID=3072793 RepID=UPI002815539A|nr:DUF126 domain-containing protein [Acuticoccus sp. MNP-M23]WMS43271.1 DUF126 domain-containing protein [Acuticoccus sp. MNP-M23]
MTLFGRAVFPGIACAPLLTVRGPLSFWGGVDPATGRIINARHADCGRSLAGQVVAIDELVGSSSSAAVLLELIANGAAPAALLLRQVDAILVVGCLTAREIGDTAPPVVHLGSLPDLPDGTMLRVQAETAHERATISPAGDACTG